MGVVLNRRLRNPRNHTFVALGNGGKTWKENPQYKPCLACDALFTARYPSEFVKKRFCSVKCRMDYRHKRKPEDGNWYKGKEFKPCVLCGKMFTERSRVEFNRRKYCSTKCGGKMRKGAEMLPEQTQLGTQPRKITYRHCTWCEKRFPCGREQRRAEARDCSFCCSEHKERYLERLTKPRHANRGGMVNFAEILAVRAWNQRHERRKRYEERRNGKPQSGDSCNPSTEQRVDEQDNRSASERKLEEFYDSFTQASAECERSPDQTHVPVNTKLVRIRGGSG